LCGCCVLWVCVGWCGEVVLGGWLGVFFWCLFFFFLGGGGGIFVEILWCSFYEVKAISP